MKPILPSSLTGARPSEKFQASSYVHGITTLPLLSMKPHLSSSSTRARPSEKLYATSYLHGTTTLPLLSMKPHLPSSLTKARPSEKTPAPSYLNGITTLPLLSMKPYLPFSSIYGTKTTSSTTVSLTVSFIVFPPLAPLSLPPLPLVMYHAPPAMTATSNNKSRISGALLFFGVPLLLSLDFLSGAGASLRGASTAGGGVCLEGAGGTLCTGDISVAASLAKAIGSVAMPGTAATPVRGATPPSRAKKSAMLWGRSFLRGCMATSIALRTAGDISCGNTGKPSFIISPALGGRMPVSRKNSVAPKPPWPSTFSILYSPFLSIFPTGKCIVFCVCCIIYLQR